MSANLTAAVEAAGLELTFRVSHMCCDAGQTSLRPGGRSPAFIWAALAEALNVPADGVLPALVSAVHRTAPADIDKVMAVLARTGDLVPQPVHRGVLRFDACDLPAALLAELEEARRLAAREIEDGGVDRDTIPEDWS